MSKAIVYGVISRGKPPLSFDRIEHWSGLVSSFCRLLQTRLQRLHADITFTWGFDKRTMLLEEKNQKPHTVHFNRPDIGLKRLTQNERATEDLYQQKLICFEISEFLFHKSLTMTALHSGHQNFFMYISETYITKV